MIKTKLCSIVIPVYNVEPYLERCIDSVISQTYKNIEVILVDDGSTDNSGTICDRYADQYSTVNVIHQTNKGLSGARNSGLLVATGEYLMYVDSDDWIENETVEILMNATERHKYDIVAHAVFKFIDNRDIRVLPNDIKEIEIDVNKYRDYLYTSCLLNQSTFSYLYPQELKCGPEMSYPVLKIFRRSFLLDNELFFPENIRFCEDKVFELMVVEKLDSLYYINIPLYHYFMRPGSLTNRDAENKMNGYLYVFKCLQETMEKIGISETHRKFFNLNVLQSSWNVIGKCGMGVLGLRDINKAKSSIKHFVNNPIVREAIAGVDYGIIKGFKHKFLYFCMRNNMYGLAIMICYMYYLAFPKKNTLKI